MTQAIAAVVVPAHNEEAVIGRTLHRLLAGTAPGELRVVVVPNACTDRTAEIARQTAARFAAESRTGADGQSDPRTHVDAPESADACPDGGPSEGGRAGDGAAERPGKDVGSAETAGDVIIVETATPGKANALRVGDEHCGTLFPRVYLDADVELDADSVRALVAACARPGVLACAPVPELDLDGVGPVARRMHRVHERLIAPHRALAGVGVYVLTEEGHARAFPIPADVISDDGWIHRSFRPDERAVVPEARSVVRPARTVRAHLRRRVRVRMGNRQLDALGLPLPEGRLKPGDLRSLVRRREVSVPDAACYLAVLLLDRALTRLRARKQGGQVAWGSDASTRITHRPAR
ncbi:glycosyltransferase [Thermopolyspora sp. NPDC052614]|uniref:glycosyltransferase n=1 Tax=Thermopolyspora sp. NPDC052614 TaxID=3155682 RepID=UPI00344A3467